MDRSGGREDHRPAGLVSWRRRAGPLLVPRLRYRHDRWRLGEHGKPDDELAALADALAASFDPAAMRVHEPPNQRESDTFILALVGWMPAGMDLSVQSSLWTLAKNRATGVTATVQEAVFDFRIGYIGTSVLALAFITLGATVMHAAGEAFSPEGPRFSIQLVDLFTATLGGWSRPIILVAVVTTMFSTLLAILDAFPRAIARTAHALAAGLEQAPAHERETPGYWAALCGLIIAATLVFHLFAGNLHRMVDLATILGFLTAPVLGYLNLRAVTGPHVPEAYRPGPLLRAFSWCGLLLMVGIAIVFAVQRLGG